MTRPLLALGFDTVQLTFMRCLLTALILVVTLLIRDKKGFKVTGTKDILIFLWTGIFGFAMMYVCYFETVENATLSLASVLLNTAPYFVMIMSAIFFKEKITKVKVIALIVATIGCVLSAGLIGTLMGGDAGSISLFGILTGVLSGFCYGTYTITGNYLLKKYSSLTIITYGFGLGAITLIPFCDFGSMLATLQNPATWPYLIALSLCCTLLPYVLYTYGLNHVEPSKASIMALMEPVVATLWGVFLFKELLSLSGFIGILMIFASVVMLNIKIGDKKL